MTTQTKSKSKTEQTTEPPPDIDVTVSRFATDDEDILDFSYARESIPFRVGPRDEDVFHAAPDIPVETAMDFAEKAEILDDDDAPVEQKKEVMRELYAMMLFPESAERFISRLSDPSRPIGVGKVNQITRRLFEEYGLRPTSPSGDSSDGSGTTPESGNNLTENTSHAELTSGDSASQDS